MTNKEYLMRGYKLNEIIESCRCEIRRLSDMTLSVGSPGTGTAVAHSQSNSASFTRRVEKIADIEAEINKRIEQYIDVKGEIFTVINDLEDNEEKLCLMLRYIEFKSWDEIAKKMNYSLRYVYKIHGNALKHIILPNNDTK